MIGAAGCARSLMRHHELRPAREENLEPVLDAES